MKTTKLILFLTVLFAATFLHAQNVKANKWDVQRSVKITSKATKDLSLSKADSAKLNVFILDRLSFEAVKLKEASTPDEKNEVYKISIADFKDKLTKTFPADLVLKIRDWWGQNNKNFNSL
ncbi:MAG: hypothetical protein WCG93_13955 [Paludibacter sp.]